MKKLARSVALKLASFCLVSMIVASPAFASDHWGGWRYLGASGTGDCLYAGTRIYTSATPDIHTLSAANSCTRTYTMSVVAILYGDGFSVIGRCENYGDNYAQCPVQKATPSDGFWYWQADLADTAGNIWYISYGQSSGSAYDEYWTSSD